MWKNTWIDYKLLKEEFLSSDISKLTVFLESKGIKNYSRSETQGWVSEKKAYREKLINDIRKERWEKVKKQLEELDKELVKSLSVWKLWIAKRVNYLWKLSISDDFLEEEWEDRAFTSYDTKELLDLCKFLKVELWEVTDRTENNGFNINFLNKKEE